MDQAPRYLSLNSADIILSEIRPTKIKSEALGSVNLLIDEVLWLVLNSARSLATERLSRDGLLRILPTTLGKEALLEAEIELKAYWDRTDPIGRGASVEQPPKSADFPLQAAFELMRFKCEVYSTLGDAEEDVEEEILLQKRMLAASPSPPKVNAVPPAALYITAILEHICEHVLANVAKVVARDSSRTSAHLQDLYVALCEDDMMYPLFKRMKVKEDLEAQNKALTMPRRSKSISVGLASNLDRQLSGNAARSNPSTPQSSRFSESNPGRNSGESAASHGGASSVSPPRSSQEKSRLRMFGGGMSNSHQDKGGLSSSLGHRRNGSGVQEEKRTDSPSGTVDHVDDDDYPTSVSNHDFDNLMNSDTTMKVSLTPDRLRTLGVSTKQKGKRVPPPNPSFEPSSSSPASATRDIDVKAPPLASNLAPTTPPSAFSLSGPKGLVHKASRSGLVPRSAQVKVESIEEGEDEDGPPANEALGAESTVRIANDAQKPRARTQSLAQMLQEAPPGDPAASKSASTTLTLGGRARSQTTSSGTSPVNSKRIPEIFSPPLLSKINTSTSSDVRAPLTKKKSSGLGHSPSLKTRQILQTSGATASPIRPSNGANAKMNGAQAPKRAPARNIEDADLDSLFADDDDDEDVTGMIPPGLGPPITSGLVPPSKNSSPGLGVSPVSASTREMMDFLSQGPPPSPPPMLRPNADSAASTTSKKAPGRFGRMISKLSRTSSTEQIKTGSMEDLSGSRSGSRQTSIRGKQAPPFPVYAMPKPPPPPPMIHPMASTSSPEANAIANSHSPSGVRSKSVSGSTTASPTTVALSVRPSTAQAHQTRQDEKPATTMAALRSTTELQVAVPSKSDAAGSVISEAAAEALQSSANASASLETASTSPPVVSAPISSSFSHARPSPSSARIVPRPVMVEKAVETAAGDALDTMAAAVAPGLARGSAIVTAEQAQQLRDLVGKATTAYECTILIEMLLAQWGLSRTADTANKSRVGSLDSHPEVLEELPLVEILLGDSGVVEQDIQPESGDSDTDDTHEVELKTPNPQTEDFISSQASPPDVPSDLPWAEPAYEQKPHPTSVTLMHGTHLL
ncbi:hypothetical protein FRB93_005268 [Tulasnella sp. JGI-2019a]|nr:hypothetical protein FRB93_005268 [Tulasnella sp. JGI-2019a]